MLSRAAIRTSQAVVGRRAFHVTPKRLSSPYHYPEGPYSNIPFNPKGKFFGVGYWTLMATFFFAPFGIASKCLRGVYRKCNRWTVLTLFSSSSLADDQAEINGLFRRLFLEFGDDNHRRGGTGYRNVNENRRHCWTRPGVALYIKS